MTGVPFPWHALCVPEDQPPAGKLSGGSLTFGSRRPLVPETIPRPYGFSRLRRDGDPCRILTFLANFLRLHPTPLVLHRPDGVGPFLLCRWRPRLAPNDFSGLVC